MAYKLRPQLSAVAAVANIEIPQEVRDDIEGMYAHLREHPDQEGYGEFDTAEEVLAFIRQAKAYCAIREAGALTFRKLPTKNLPATVLRFSLKANLEANGARQSEAETTANAVAEDRKAATPPTR